MIIAPSILSVKKEDLDHKLNEFVANGIKYLHLDIMDGVFVTNNTEKVELLKKVNHYPFYFDSHLMVINPDNYINDFKEAGTNLITFHYEAVNDPMDIINKIKEAGLEVGISIKPNTDVQVLDCLLPYVDLVLVMSVEPGYGGQAFIPSAYDKVDYLNKFRKESQLKYLIEVDGGINTEISTELNKLGCDIVVMGSYLINNDVEEIVRKINNL